MHKRKEPSFFLTQTMGDALDGLRTNIKVRTPGSESLSDIFNWSLSMHPLSLSDLEKDIDSSLSTLRTICL